MKTKSFLLSFLAQPRPPTMFSNGNMLLSTIRVQFHSSSGLHPPKSFSLFLQGIFWHRGKIGAQDRNFPGEFLLAQPALARHSRLLALHFSGQTARPMRGSRATNRLFLRSFRYVSPISLQRVDVQGRFWGNYHSTDALHHALGILLLIKMRRQRRLI